MTTYYEADRVATGTRIPRSRSVVRRERLGSTIVKWAKWNQRANEKKNK